MPLFRPWNGHLRPASSAARSTIHCPSIKRSPRWPITSEIARMYTSQGDKSYQSAIVILNSRRRPGRPRTKDATDGNAPDEISTGNMPGVKGRPDLRGRPSIAGMAEWLGYVGHSVSDINSLNIIHVAGTKGKGSTCAFAESFLRARGQRTGWPRRTGLYTSPHLKFPEERIRINFEPVSKQLFAKYFFEVWDALQANCPAAEFATSPRYLQLYALVSYHAFLCENVDAAVYETHHGGEYDATNFITGPVVTAITTLGMDHVAQLGPSLENIAWHKAGIMKAAAAAFTAPQEPGPMIVLEDRAREKGVSLRVVDPSDPDLSLGSIQPEVQRTNCALACAAVDAFLKAKSPTESNPGLPSDLFTPEDIRRGIEQFHWPGRFQLDVREPYHWFLDSAHNELSMSQAATWFGRGSRVEANSTTSRVLIFSQDSTQRDGADVLESLAAALDEQKIRFDHVIFTTYVPTAHTTRNDYCVKDIPELPAAAPPAPPERYPELWRQVDSTAQIHVYPYIDEALAFTKGLSKDGSKVHTLVTGSQHLVGGVLRLLEGSFG